MKYILSGIIGALISVATFFAFQWYRVRNRKKIKNEAYLWGLQSAYEYSHDALEQIKNARAELPARKKQILKMKKKEIKDKFDTIFRR